MIVLSTNKHVDNHAAGDPVQLTQQPDNPYDPHAVHATTLYGASLGYVPRTITQHILHPVTMGWVYSVGRGKDSGNLGAFVRATRATCHHAASNRSKCSPHGHR